jgi:hypothetical protein
MSDFEINPRPVIYQIRLQGNLDERWSGWFNGMLISSEANSQITTLTGIIPDQAKLRGILNRIWDLNLSLVSVTRSDD